MYLPHARDVEGPVGTAVSSRDVAPSEGRGQIGLHRIHPSSGSSSRVLGRKRTARTELGRRERVIFWACRRHCCQEVTCEPRLACNGGANHEECKEAF